MSASWLPPLAVAVPVLGACLVLGIGKHVPRAVVDWLSLLAAGTAAGLLAALLAATGRGRVVTWSGGWLPEHGRGVGIVLVADQVGAVFALLAAVLTVCALVYTWRYFDSAEAHFQVLVLLFLAGLVGFALTGDLFDLFVFFELMGATAYALTGHKIEEPQSVHGGFAFGVVNSLGAYFSLMGIGLLYARTGKLGLPQLATALAGRRADALVVAGAVLVLTGLLVKAAIVPFHFWLADAHAVAPTPVCVLFSGVMAPLGVYGVARVSTVVFTGVLPDGALHRAFLVLGLPTAVLGAVLCLTQRHLKRLLAYSTIAHLGLFLVAVADLSADGVAGLAGYAVGHAGVKAALFLLVGLLLARHGSVDEHELHGRARGDGLARWLFPLAALVLAGLPPFGTGLGKAAGEDAVRSPLLVAVFVLVSATTGAAVLRAAVRVHFGLGRRPVAETAELTCGHGEQPELEPRHLGRTPVTMLAPVVVLLALTLAVGVLPGLTGVLGAGAARFTDHAGYLAQALHGAAATPPAPVAGPHWTATGVWWGLVSAGLAVALAACAWFANLLPDRVLRGLRAAVEAPVRVLHRLHSGHVGDYVAWLVFGVALLGALIAV